MPITEKEWNLMEFDDVGFGIRTRDVQIFLKKNKDNAYTINEISKEINNSAKNVAGILSKLKIRGIVEHRKPYWRASQK